MSDLISREDVINAMMILKRADDLAYGCEIPESFDSERAIEALKNIPSAEPEFKDTYEWCTECKEYDHDKHCCPR